VRVCMYLLYGLNQKKKINKQRKDKVKYFAMCASLPRSVLFPT